MEMKMMENRSRNNQLKIYLSEEEKNLFETKMKMTRCRTMSHFIRKCVMEKEIYIVDLEPFIKLQSSLGIANNNINQIARRVNKTGVIYKTDIKEIKNDIAKISKEQWDIHSLLLNRTKKLNK
jgi:Bacterial mobilisation protein (MobC).